MEADMSNKMITLPAGNDSAICEGNDEKMMNSEVRDALSNLKEEMHAMLQLPPEDLAKVDYIEWKLDWKPVLTSRIYPKKD